MEYFSVWDSTEVLKRLEWDKCETFHQFKEEELIHQAKLVILEKLWGNMGSRTKVTWGGAWKDSENLSL